MIYNFIISFQKIPLNPRLTPKLVGLKNYSTVITDINFNSKMNLDIILLIFVTILLSVFIFLSKNSKVCFSSWGKIALIKKYGHKIEQYQPLKTKKILVNAVVKTPTKIDAVSNFVKFRTKLEADVKYEIVENAKTKANSKIVKKRIKGFFINVVINVAKEEGQKYPQKNLEIVKFNPTNNPINKEITI